MKKLFEANYSQWQVELFRVLLAILLFHYFYSIYQYSGVFFLDRGILPHSEILRPIPAEPLFFFPVSDFGVSVFKWLHLGALCGLLLFGGRAFSLACLVFHYFLGVRNSLILLPFDFLVSALLLYLSFIPNGKMFSLFPGAWKEKSPNAVSALLGRVMIRVMQVHLCIVYFYNGFYKIVDSPGIIHRWWNLEMAERAWASADSSLHDLYSFRFLLDVPFAPELVTLFGWLFPIYFPLAIWVAGWRPWVLLLGVLFHVVVYSKIELLHMNLGMLAVYLFFINPQFIESLSERIRGLWSRNEEMEVPDEVVE